MQVSCSSTPRTAGPRSPLRIIVIGLLAGLVSGCLNPQEDRLEPLNRQIFQFNESLDALVVKPAARAYVDLAPEPVQDGVWNFFDNLGYPTVVVNQFLQGKPDLGVQDTGRFLVNLTLGVGGVMDVATGMGLRRHEEDFGQTFGVWGLPQGAYLVAPLWGSVTVRSGIGDALDALIYPMRFLVEDSSAQLGATALFLVSARAELLEVDKLVQGDRYIFFRDTYLQRREYLVNDGEVSDPFLDDGF